VFINGYKRTYEIPFVKPVSTIGAGDNFNAGFLYGLISYEADIKKIQSFSVCEIDRLIGFGLAFAAQACQSPENYIPEDFEPTSANMYI